MFNPFLRKITSQATILLSLFLRNEIKIFPKINFIIGTAISDRSFMVTNIIKFVIFFQKVSLLIRSFGVLFFLVNKR